MANSPDLFAALDAAYEEIQEERQQLDAREQALLRAREELSQALGGNGTPRLPQPQQRSRAGVPQQVARHHLDAISDYLVEHGPTRQADLAKALELNGGTVSLAVRRLERDGLIRSLPEKERNSVVWEPAATASSPRQRSMSRA